MVGLNGWKRCSNLAEVDYNQIRLLLTSSMEILGFLHPIFIKILNFPEKIVPFQISLLGLVCDPTRLDAWLIDFFVLIIPEIFDFNHF